MRRLAAVQHKVPCVFLTEVKEEPSRKRHLQHFQVVATEKLNPRAEASHVQSSIATEKLDGTCCYVSSYQGRPCLWARLDRKPNKQADKRFKKFLQSLTSCKDFTWNIEEDFKSVPECWIPALGVQHQNGHPVPDDNGHIPGWVPVEKSSKQYCWHASAVNYDAGVALVLRPNTDNGDVLEIAAVPLSELLEQTLELIGTNINANPYGLGSKKRPVHLLVPHGALQISNPPPVNYSQLLRWFHDCEEAKVEGIVWHCLNGTLVKLHRHHLGLNWPNGAPFLNTRPVVISLSLALLDLDISSQDLFAAFSRLAGQSFDHIQDLRLET